jgi:hypothetical protein
MPGFPWRATLPLATGSYTLLAVKKFFERVMKGLGH